MPQGKKNPKTVPSKKEALKKSEILGCDATFTKLFTGNKELMEPERLFSKGEGA